MMVLRFGKIIDWTSRNTAIGRISLDDENLYKLCMFSWLWFLLISSKIISICTLNVLGD